MYSVLLSGRARRGAAAAGRRGDGPGKRRNDSVCDVD
jgi:hypothetical protein